jgi:hypothetical protein
MVVRTTPAFAALTSRRPLSRAVCRRESRIPAGLQPPQSRAASEARDPWGSSRNHESRGSHAGRVSAGPADAVPG